MIDGYTCRSHTLPSTYPKRDEIPQALDTAATGGRVLQSGPDISHPQNIVSHTFQPLGIRRPRAEDQLVGVRGHEIDTGQWLVADRTAGGDREPAR